MSETFRVHEFDVPVDLLNMTGGGVDTFDAIANMHMTNLRKFIGIEPNHNVLEIGCGVGRDAIPLTKLLWDKGSYLGIDIIEPSIVFCQTNITPRYPHFRFVRFNVKDDLHNPAGQDAMVDQKVPLPDASVDRAFAWSVLTHLWEADIRHYLGELYRVMRPGAKAYLTCFLLSPEIIARAQKTNLTRFDLRFEHEVYPGCFINNPDMPLGAIGYTAELLESMIRDSGMALDRPFVKGAWSGYHPVAEDGQDGMVLIRP